MGIPVHLHGQLRTCGATTVVTGQSSLTVDGQLWAVSGDPNTDGGGGLIPSVTDIWIEGSLVIIDAPDGAVADDLCPGPPVTHCNPATNEGYSSVTVY